MIIIFIRLINLHNKLASFSKPVKFACGLQKPRPADFKPKYFRKKPKSGEDFSTSDLSG